VLQRELFPEFLEMYLPVVQGLRFGHPLVVEAPGDELPDLQFGPVICAAKATELREHYAAAVGAGGIPLHHGSLPDGRFLPGQDTGAYVAPACVMEPPNNWVLRQCEPFGPLESIVLVDSENELLAAMNASNGPLIASVATDTDFGARVAEQLQAFRVGLNTPRSRGRPRGGLRRQGRELEGRRRRRRPARAGRHRGRGTGLRQLPDLLPLPHG